MQRDATMLNYAFFYPIYIYRLFKTELRLFSYERIHFNMLFKQINANISLNILNIDENSILWN